MFAGARIFVVAAVFLLSWAAVAPAATVRGTSRSDRLSGTDGADRIFGRSGDDRIRGRRGADRLQGGNGSDRVRGGSGNDRINGNRGDDRLHGDSGRDLLTDLTGRNSFYGGSGNDTLDGGLAADRLSGGRGADSLDGRGGDDRLYGGTGNDYIQGGSGNDVISDRRGSDHFVGGEGDDVIDSRDGVMDRVDCGEGQDTVAADPEDELGASCETGAPAQSQPTEPPAATRGGWIVCTEASTDHAEPGLTMTPQPIVLTITDMITDCVSSDPTIQTGTGDIRATSFAGSCAGGPLDGIADLTWNNGRTTSLVFTGAFGGGLATARGAVISGTAFVGQHFYAADLLRLDPSVFAACGSPEGLTTFQADGRLTIGLPFIGPG